MRFVFTVEESDLAADAMGRVVPALDDFAAWGDIIMEAFGVNVTIERIDVA